MNRSNEVMNADDLEVMLRAQAMNQKKVRPPQHPMYEHSPRPVSPRPFSDEFMDVPPQYLAGRQVPRQMGNPFQERRAGSIPPNGAKMVARPGQYGMPLRYPMAPQYRPGHGMENERMMPYQMLRNPEVNQMRYPDMDSLRNPDMGSLRNAEMSGMRNVEMNPLWQVNQKMGDVEMHNQSKRPQNRSREKKSRDNRSNARRDGQQQQQNMQRAMSQGVQSEVRFTGMPNDM